MNSNSSQIVNIKCHIKPGLEVKIVITSNYSPESTIDLSVESRRIPKEKEETEIPSTPRVLTQQNEHTERVDTLFSSFSDLEEECINL